MGGWSAAFGSRLYRHHEVAHDVVLPLGRVLAHVEGENLLAVGFRRVFDAAQAHVRIDSHAPRSC